MSRSQPYRSRMPIQIIRGLDVASRITLFMVGQSGPLSFTFKDRLDHKYKTSIGADLKCSCSPNKNDHCLHTLYVMLKIFKISPQNPIVWQAAYVDSQLSDILSGKYTVITNRSHIFRPVYQDEEGSSSQLPSDYLERRNINKQLNRHNNKIQQGKAQRMLLNEDSVCPICQQIMDQSMCLAYCKFKCGNNFHVECIKIWAEHKKTTQTEITCPMCRTQMGESFLIQINILQRKHKKAELQKIKIKYKCSGCGVTEIPKNVHKCTLCKSFELCEACYTANKHIKHPFIKQSSQDGKWRGAEERRQSQIKMKNFIDGRRKQKNMNQILLQKLRKVEEDPAKILDFVASTYPYVSKYISQNIDPYKKLDFNPDQMKCMKCNAKKMIFLRRLTCGHFIDHQCLKQSIRKQKFHCEQCGVKILKGYQNLVERQKENNNKKQKQGIRLQINDQFDPQHMQNNKYAQNSNEHDDYNFVLPQQASLGDILGRVRESIHEQEQNERLGHRLARNIVRGSEQINYVSSHVDNEERRHNRMLSNNNPQRTVASVAQRNVGVNRISTRREIQRQPGYSTNNNNNNNNIRIRNVGNSVGATKKSEKERQNSRNSRKNMRKKEDFGLMIQAMIGRKVF